MSDTNINQYYPEEVPQSLVAGEAPGAAASQPSEESPVGAEPTRTDGEKETVNAGEGVVDLGIDLPDIPLPDDEPIEDGVKDTFDDAAFNFAIVGVGQGGSRLAESFWNLGYRRVGVINTAQQDLSLIKMPEENKLLIGDGEQVKIPMRLMRFLELAMKIF